MKRLLILPIQLGLIFVFGCGPTTQAPLNDAVGDEPIDTGEPIPEVVKNELVIDGEGTTECGAYKDAAHNIWSYDVQTQLNFSVQIYEGKIVAGDAEQLIKYMDAFTAGWLDRFEKLCGHFDQEMLASGQFVECANCLRQLLDIQKDYVNVLFFERVFSLEAASQISSQLSFCDVKLEPRGEKALKDNPFI